MTIKVTHQCNIIPSAFSVCAVQSWTLGYCSWLIAIKYYIKNEGLAMVQAPCEPKDLVWVNYLAFTYTFSVRLT